MSYWLLCSSGRSCSCALPLRTLLSSADRARASCQCVCHRSLLSVHRGQCGGDGAEVSPRTSDLWGVYFDLAGPLCQLLLSALPRPSEQPFSLSTALVPSRKHPLTSFCKPHVARRSWRQEAATGKIWIFGDRGVWHRHANCRCVYDVLPVTLDCSY